MASAINFKKEKEVVAEAKTKPVEQKPLPVRECPHDKTPLLTDQLNCPSCGTRVTGEVISKALPEA